MAPSILLDTHALAAWAAIGDPAAPGQTSRHRKAPLTRKVSLQNLRIPQQLLMMLRNLNLILNRNNRVIALVFISSLSGFLGFSADFSLTPV